jgi:MFS family permease
MGPKYISRTIWILSFISLFTDVASEMLYPVIPVYLKEIGFSVVLIGILEGVAEAVVGLSKGYFGKLSDASGRRVPFVQLGYALSAISRPMMAMFIYPVWIFLARSMDRLGKGIRTGARDAILSDEATPQTKGKVFGFHRSMDTLGAVLGPSLALLYLYFYPGEYKTLFLIAFIPGVLSIIGTMFLKDKKIQSSDKPKPRVSFLTSLSYWKSSSAIYRKVVIGLLAFALFNSSDIFLLLMVKQAGMSDTFVIGVYIFYNFVYALCAFPLGIIADRIGLKNIFIVGLTLFAAVYFGMATTQNLYIYLFLFFLYGIYSAATEGISKAWISNISKPEDTATAIGTFAGFQSICVLLASSLAGLIWYYFGATFTFLLTAVVTILVILYFLILIQRSKHSGGIEILKPFE